MPETIPRPTPYNPLEKQALGEQIVSKLLSEPVSELPPPKFSGAGVYALYYTGGFAPYAQLAALNRNGSYACPIYVGKAIPSGARKAIRADDDYEGVALHKRLSDHAASIAAVSNLELEDFRCRFLAVDDIWIAVAEIMLIDRFKPVWNCLLEGFGNHNPGRGRKNMVKPAWDTVHPGREWADGLSPGEKTAQQLAAEAVGYLAATNRGIAP